MAPYFAALELLFLLAATRRPYCELLTSRADPLAHWAPMVRVRVRVRLTLTLTLPLTLPYP